MKYFSILWLMKNNVRFACVLYKNIWFCFISIIWVHFSHKTEKNWFWKSLKYLYKKIQFFWKKGYDVRFEYVPWKIVLLPLFGFTLVIKIRNFDFESHWDAYFIKKMMSDLNIPCQAVSDWFKLCCLSRILAICWEIWILNFIEIV